MTESRDTIIDRFLNRIDDKGREPALWYREDQQWRSIDWETYGERCRLFAGALVANDYEPGDHMAICSYNCPEWVIADIGAMMGRAVPVGIYNTNSPSEVAYIARHCEASLLVVEDREQWDKVDQVRDDLPDLERVVMIREADEVEDEMVVDFETFLEEGREHLEAVESRIERLDPDDVATMIYTSGTTGDPKGVMLTHHNLAFTASAAEKAIGDVREDDCMVSYLPLSHIAEQTFTIHLPLTFGYAIWFAPGLYEVRDALEVARPSFFFGVPRIWEKFESALKSRLDEASGVRKLLVDWARSVGREAGREFIEHGEVTGFLKLKYELADFLFFSRLKQQLGLDRLRVAISAAAPIGRDVLEFFLSCDIIIREVYGQSEDCGPTTVNFPQPGETKLGTVGRPLPGIEVEISDGGLYEGQEEGEILVRGDNVFKGYYKDQEATDETLDDEGWLHSGDIGTFDEDGFLTITGRKKEIIITAGGKNISPKKIESKIKEIDGISHAVVIGDQRKYLTALLTINPDRTEALADQHGWGTDAPEALADDPDFRDYIDRHVEAINEDLARVETIKKFTILPEDFTQESGELTPTRKVKRRVVEDKYGDAIDAMYS